MKFSHLMIPTSARASLSVLCFGLFFLFVAFAQETDQHDATRGEDDLTHGEGDPNIVIVTDNSLDGVLEKSTIVQFFAPWCGHCKKLAPTWADFAAKMADKDIVVAQMDATENELSGRRFQIRGFPTIKFFHEGKMYDFPQKERTLKNLIDFVENGYSTEEGFDIPPPMTTFQFFASEFKGLAEELQMSVTRNPGVSVVIFSLGGLFGVTLCLSILCICDRQPAKTTTTKKAKARKAD